MSPLTAAIVAALRDPEIASALRDVFASAPLRDERLPLARAAKEILVVRTSTTKRRPEDTEAKALQRAVRVLRDAARHKDPAKRLAIEGPRNARCVLRAELDRWLAVTAPKPGLAKASTDDTANDTSDERADHGTRARNVERFKARAR